MIPTEMHWFYLLAALAQGSQVWGRFDHERPGNDLALMLMLLMAAAVVGAIGLVWLRLQRRNNSGFQLDSRRALFRELCRAHGLPASSRRLLKRLAAARGLANPAILFVEPRYFETDKLPQRLQARKSQLQRMRDSLFR